MSADQLKNAFRFHRRTTRNPRQWQKPAPNAAWDALNLARADVAAGKIRHPAPIKGYAMRAGQDSDKPGSVYVENPESFGLRLVGRVMADCGGYNGIWERRGNSGWYDNPFSESYKDGSGLIYGLVYQLPGSKGESRFVAAYQNGANDSGALIDFSKIYTEPRGFGYASAFETDAARSAAFAADHMAKNAAETEREYQAAWQAGARYSDESSDLATIRAEIRGILSERRQLRGTSGYPALCGAITARVRSLLNDMAKRRKKLRDLAKGDSPSLSFWNGDKRLRDAFCEGAGLEEFPA